MQIILDDLTSSQLKVCNRELMQQVRNLSNRIDTKPQNNNSQTRSNFSAELSADFIEGSPSKETVSNAVDYREIKKLKDEVGHIAHWKGFSGKVYQIGKRRRKLQLIESDKMISD